MLHTSMDDLVAGPSEGGIELTPFRPLYQGLSSTEKTKFKSLKMPSLVKRNLSKSIPVNPNTD